MTKDLRRSCAICAVTGILVTACDIGSQRQQSSVTRDSAGVRIVENNGTGWDTAGGWREDSIVAAGTLLLEGTVIPPRSMVMGSPGKVRRPLTDEEVASILVYSRNYVGYRLDYLVRG